MYVCICMCMCVCVCVYMYVYVCMYVFVYVHACLRVCVRTHVCLYICVCTYVSIRACTCARVYVRVCRPALRLLLLSHSLRPHLWAVQHGAGLPAQHSCSTHLGGSSCLNVLISDPDPSLSLTLSLVSTFSSFEAQQGWGRSPGYGGPDHPRASSMRPQPQPRDGIRERPNLSRNRPSPRSSVIGEAEPPALSLKKKSAVLGLEP